MLRGMNPILTIRSMLGLTQVELAAVLQCSQAAVSFYELGKHAMRPQRARRLIAYAGKRGVPLALGDIYVAQRGEAK